MTSDSSPPTSPSSGPGSRASAYLRLCGLPAAAAGEFARRSIEEVQGRLDAWAASLVPAQPGESERQHEARGRAQTLLARAPARWPGYFLRPPPPAELTAAVQSVVLEAKRPLRKTSMTPEPIDLGPVSDVADETWRTFDTWPVLRGLTVWLLFSLLLGAVFYVVRF